MGEGQTTYCKSIFQLLPIEQLEFDSNTVRIGLGLPPTFLSVPNGGLPVVRTARHSKNPQKHFNQERQVNDQLLTFIMLGEAQWRRWNISLVGPVNQFQKTRDSMQTKGIKHPLFAVKYNYYQYLTANNGYYQFNIIRTSQSYNSVY